MRPTRPHPAVDEGNHPHLIEHAFTLPRVGTRCEPPASVQMSGRTPAADRTWFLHSPDPPSSHTSSEVSAF